MANSSTKPASDSASVATRSRIGPTPPSGSGVCCRIVVAAAVPTPVRANDTTRARPRPIRTARSFTFATTKFPVLSGSRHSVRVDPRRALIRPSPENTSPTRPTTPVEVLFRASDRTSIWPLPFPIRPGIAFEMMVVICF